MANFINKSREFEGKDENKVPDLGPVFLEVPKLAWLILGAAILFVSSRRRGSKL